MATIAYEAGFDSASLRVSASTPDEESWLMNAGSPRFEETVCRLDDTNVRVLSVQVIRVDLDIKGRTTSPRWSQQPCWERVT